MFSVEATVLCTLSPVLVSVMLGLIGTKAAFSAVRSSSGGGMSLLRDRSAAMAVLVSSWRTFTVRVPISGGSAFAAVEVEVEALASVLGTCTDFSLVVVAVFPADRGNIILHFLWAARMVFDGLRNRFGLRHLHGGEGSSASASNLE